MFVGASLVVEAAEEAAGANGEGGEKDECSSNRLLLSGVSPEKNGDVGSNTNELECSPFVALWAAVTAWPVMLLPSFPHVWFVGAPLSTNAPMTKDEWNIFVKVVERWMGWEHTYESITNMALMYWDEYIRPQE